MASDGGGSHAATARLVVRLKDCCNVMIHSIGFHLLAYSAQLSATVAVIAAVSLAVMVLLMSGWISTNGHAKDPGYEVFHGFAGKEWWQTGVIYQVYPWSFCDADGDGIGDLAGIKAKLDHLSSLNITCIWLNPIFSSPMKDLGYDVANYTAIDPIFGSLDDLRRLMDAAHSRNIHVILDLVPNHTSDQHHWFEQSRNATYAPKRDWYVWQPPDENNEPPTNWRSFFGGSAWTFDNQTGMYYLHQFLASQPDLNWSNPNVKEAIFEVMEYWLEFGIDGFRVDSPYVPYIDASTLWFSSFGYTFNT